MTKIKNTNAYPFDVTISDLDYVIGSDGDNLGKITRNYNIGDLRRYINSGLSPEVGGTLKVSEITYNGVLTSPSEVANALDPNYEVLQYHVVIFSINGNKYILKEQDITLGLSGTAITDEDFILIIGFTKLGDGTNVLKGYNSTTGLHEFYSIKKEGNLLTLTESLGNIILSIDEVALNTFVEDNQKTYSVANVGTGATVYKDNTVVGNNTQFNFKSVLIDSQDGMGESFVRDIQQNTNDITVRVKKIKSDTLTITATNEEISLDLAESAQIPALYVNNLYIPTYNDWVNAGGDLVTNASFLYRGEGTLAKPFTDSINYTSTVAYTITLNTSIQNALDAYVGSGTRLAPERLGERIIIQDNNGNYTFNGNFGYSGLKLKIESDVIATTTGYIVDMDNTLHFNNSDVLEVFISEGSTLVIDSGEGFKNNGTTEVTTNYLIRKQILLIGLGTIRFDGTDITKYLINSDKDSNDNTTVGFNNDGAWQFEVRCKLVSEYQGLIAIGGKAWVLNFGATYQTGSVFNDVDINLKAFYLKGGRLSFRDSSNIILYGSNSTTRLEGFVFEPTNAFSTSIDKDSCNIIGNLDTLYSKVNTSVVDLNISNSGSNSLSVNEVFNSPNLWAVSFKNNRFSSGNIDFTKVDLTQTNSTSAVNYIGANIIESLRIFEDRADAIANSVPLYSAYIKTSGVAYPNTAGWVRDIVLPA